jgi:hypothetical protein
MRKIFVSLLPSGQLNVFTKIRYEVERELYTYEAWRDADRIISKINKTPIALYFLIEAKTTLQALFKRVLVESLNSYNVKMIAFYGAESGQVIQPYKIIPGLFPYTTLLDAQSILSLETLPLLQSKAVTAFLTYFTGLRVIVRFVGVKVQHDFAKSLSVYKQVILLGLNCIYISTDIKDTQYALLNEQHYQQLQRHPIIEFGIGLIQDLAGLTLRNYSESIGSIHLHHRVIIELTSARVEMLSVSTLVFKTLLKHNLQVKTIWLRLGSRMTERTHNEYKKLNFKIWFDDVKKNFYECVQASKPRIHFTLPFLNNTIAKQYKLSSLGGTHSYDEYLPAVTLLYDYPGNFSRQSLWGEVYGGESGVDPFVEERPLCYDSTIMDRAL